MFKKLSVIAVLTVGVSSLALADSQSVSLGQSGGNKQGGSSSSIVAPSPNAGGGKHQNAPHNMKTRSKGRSHSAAHAGRGHGAAHGRPHSRQGRGMPGAKPSKGMKKSGTTIKSLNTKNSGNGKGANAGKR